MTSRRTFIKALGALSLTASSIAKAERFGASRPNIILFFVDDMGWQDTSVPFYYKNGVAQVTTLNKRYKTPNMQRLADKGMIFTSAYSQSVCTPTRSSMLSGMNSARSRITNWTGGMNAPTNAGGGKLEGLVVPEWTSNGLQPIGTLPEGRVAPPFWAPTATAEEKAKGRPYKLTRPYACAKTLPMFLRDAGYTTIHCGKAHFGVSNYNRRNGKGQASPGSNPIAMGFDYNIAGCELGHPPSYMGKSKYGGLPGLDENNWVNRDQDIFLTDVLTTRAISLLDEVRTSQGKPVKPFYLYMAHYALHTPLGNDRAWDRTRSDNVNLAQDTLNPNPKDDVTWNAIERNYCTLIKGMDDSVGALMDYLEEKNIADNTVILFMSDNGGLTGIGGRMNDANSPLRMGKGSCYEGGIREPMIAAWPGVIKPKSRCDTPVICEDFFSTILELTGLDPTRLSGLSKTSNFKLPGWKDIPQVVDGVSFLPLLKGEKGNTKRPLIFHYPNTWSNFGSAALQQSYNLYTAMRYDNWKLIYQHSTQKLELYNLDRDIGEANDLAKKNSAQVKKLAKIMADELRRMNAAMPTFAANNILGVAAGTRVPYPDALIK